MKDRKPHEKTKFTFTWRGKAEFVTEIEATSEGKAWREFRRHHVPHAKQKDYKVVELSKEPDCVTDN